MRKYRILIGLHAHSTRARVCYLISSIYRRHTAQPVPSIWSCDKNFNCREGPFSQSTHISGNLTIINRIESKPRWNGREPRGARDSFSIQFQPNAYRTIPDSCTSHARDTWRIFVVKYENQFHFFHVKYDRTGCWLQALAAFVCVFFAKILLVSSTRIRWDLMIKWTNATWIFVHEESN